MQIQLANRLQFGGLERDKIRYSWAVIKDENQCLKGGIL